MIGPVLAGKDLDKVRWLARKPTPHVAMVRGAEMQVEKLKITILALKDGVWQVYPDQTVALLGLLQRYIFMLVLFF